MKSAVPLILFVAVGTAAQSYSADRKFDSSDLRTHPPALTQKVEPEYTEEARGAAIEGSVVLYVEIGIDGRAHRIRVIKGLGFGLDGKAIDAVRQWRFSPGMKNGAPATVPATIEVKFHLDAPPNRI
jgi:TonB family protein